VLGVARYFGENKLKFPTLVRGGPRAGEYDWLPLSASRAGRVLRNPMHAGAYVYGRSRTKKKLVESPGGMPQVKKFQVMLPREDWQFVIYDHHPGYITWSQFLKNQERINHNRSLPGLHRQGAAKCGSALLQGIVLCGKCGHRMSVHYAHHGFVFYHCQSHLVHFGTNKCQKIPGESVETAVTKLFLEAVAPAQIKLSISACQNLDQRTQLENLQFEARLKRANAAVAKAKERLLFIDYTNRSAFNCAQEDLKRSEEELGRLKRDQLDRQKNQMQTLGPEELRMAETLTQDLPRIWAASATDFVTKKKLIRALINEVTLIRDQLKVRIAIRWRTLACSEIDVELPSPGAKLRTRAEIIELIKKLARGLSNKQIAEALNEAGIRNGRGGLFTKKRVKRLRERYRIMSKNLDGLEPSKGYYGVPELAQLLDVKTATIRNWISKGLLHATRNGSKGVWKIILTPDDLSKLNSPVRDGTRPHVFLRPGKRSGTSTIALGESPTLAAV
jgi:Recombinase zinc beta ribbon domain/Recombinase/Helix-turn-helix domain